MGSTPIALNVGLMNPRKGFTPVTGKNLGWTIVLRISYCWLPQDVVFKLKMFGIVF